MNTILLLSVLVARALSAEIPREPQYPPLKAESHPIFKKHSDEHHPVYRDENTEVKEREDVLRGMVPIAKHDMLADAPAPIADSSDNMPATGFINPGEVAYPDIPYAPGYGYGNAYANAYDLYGNSLSDYFMEPDTSSMGLLWSQVPNSRTLVSYVGRTIHWMFSSIFVIMLGSLLTIGVCSYTNLCSITFNGVGPIHEEMRSLITPERLEKISTAADFVKTAINKYQTIQKVADNRKRRSF
ncbi:uncharacterized protein LOC123714432 [Pieris brassicae]|uniref:uncharacterized protein LOC123714432 n=1 Tax=Pieris brassicae TaxID=7116 RepID=UPI001E65EBBE|nr:uncharacterized protein LOC123714432 [Pieris brassicae]